MLDTSPPVVDKSLKTPEPRFVVCPKCKKKTIAKTVEDRGTYIALKAFCPTVDNQGDEGAIPHGPICNIDPHPNFVTGQPSGFTDLQMQTLARMMAALLPAPAPVASKSA